MKKFLLSFLVIFAACSNDSNNSTTSSSPYNPPVWIQGTWGFAATQSSAETALYKFTSDNVCQIISSINSTNCWKEAAQTYQSDGITHTAEDSETATTYEAKLGAGGNTVTLDFRKVSDTKINWVNNGTTTELVKL